MESGQLLRGEAFCGCPEESISRINTTIWLANTAPEINPMPETPRKSSVSCKPYGLSTSRKLRKFILIVKMKFEFVRADVRHARWLANTVLD